MTLDELYESIPVVSYWSSDFFTSIFGIGSILSIFIVFVYYIDMIIKLSKENNKMLNIFFTFLFTLATIIIQFSFSEMKYSIDINNWEYEELSDYASTLGDVVVNKDFIRDISVSRDSENKGSVSWVNNEGKSVTDYVNFSYDSTVDAPYLKYNILDEDIKGQSTKLFNRSKEVLYHKGLVLNMELVLPVDYKFVD